ncbi:MAG: hypothetical protein L6R40_000821 [Gallowayella cf. fulva]|nr:MAG: hypothetical protein L6R40_000821 [Xanthomendoza cf. fulva]
MDRALDLLTQATHMVRENEPGNIRYQLHVEMNGDERGESIVFLETYKDQAAWDAHCEGEAYKMLVKTMTEENLIAPPTVMKFIKPIAGWESK